MLAQSPEPELHNKVLDNYPDQIEFGNVGFWGEGKPECLKNKPLGARREPTTSSTHIWRRVRESNPRHIGGRQALSPLCHPCSPLRWNKLWLCPNCSFWNQMWKVHVIQLTKGKTGSGMNWIEYLFAQCHTISDTVEWEVRWFQQ